jgi:LPS-assembly protein
MLSKLFIYFGVFILLFATAHNLMAADVSLSRGPVTIDADTIAYDKQEDTFHAKGDAVISFSQGFLMADSATLNRKTNDAFAEGNVMVMSEGDLLEGEKVRFNIETKTGVVYEGKMFLEKNHFYIKGSKIMKKGVETYRVTDATATTCDGDSPDWRLAGREMNVTIDGYGTLKQGKFFVKDIPVFYIPFAVFPAKTNRQSGFLFPKFSYSQNKFGLDIEVPFYWAISESTDATFYQRYMEKRGFKEGLEFRYFLDGDSFGTVYADFMNDTGRVTETVGGLSRNWQSDQKRWSFYLNHETAFSPSFYLRTDIKRVSDSWYFRDFTSSNYYLDNYSSNEKERFKKVSFVGNESLGSLDSTIRMVKSWSLYNLTFLLQSTDDFSGSSNDLTLQRYPEIALSGTRAPLFGTPVHFEVGAVYDYYYRASGQRGHLFDLQPVFTLPLNVGDYFQVTPQAAFKGTVWSRDDAVDTYAGKNGSRFLSNIGATVSTELHRVYDVGGRRVDKLRHGIKPELTYSYIPDTGQNDIPDYVTKVPEQHTVMFALTNTVVARLKDEKGGKRYMEFLRFKISQTYNIKEATRSDAAPSEDKRPLGDIDMELDVTPMQYLSFSARNTFSVNSGEWKKTNYDLILSDSRGDSATVGYRYARSSIGGTNPFASISPFYSYQYTQSPLEEINLSLKAVVTKFFDLTYLLRRNELDKKTLENTYGLVYHKQCWGVEIKYSETEGDKRYTVAFSLYGFGKVGAW